MERKRRNLSAGKGDYTIRTMLMLGVAYKAMLEASGRDAELREC